MDCLQTPRGGRTCAGTERTALQRTALQRTALQAPTNTGKQTPCDNNTGDRSQHGPASLFHPTQKADALS